MITKTRHFGYIGKFLFQDFSLSKNTTFPTTELKVSVLAMKMCVHYTWTYRSNSKGDILPTIFDPCPQTAEVQRGSLHWNGYKDGSFFSKCCTKPIIIVESEPDPMLVQQEASYLICSVAWGNRQETWCRTAYHTEKSPGDVTKQLHFNILEWIELGVIELKLKKLSLAIERVYVNRLMII